MVRYKCTEDNIETLLSECPICHKRTEFISSEIYWCEKCNVPVYEKECPICKEICQKIGADLRPVFPEERLLIEIIMGEAFKYIEDSVWAGIGNVYYINGKKIRIPVKHITNVDLKEISREYIKNKDFNSYDGFNKYCYKFITVNNKRYCELTCEAFDYILEKAKNIDISEMFVSFSGGKDSTVISDIVVKALGNPQILHVYGDTTLEFPETQEYIKRFRLKNPKIPLVVARNKEKDFFTLCKTIGPPSRTLRWCCTIFKTGAINRKISRMFKGRKEIITFYGIRRRESISRNKYERESVSPKITKETVISPIIDWFNFDIWLYILTTGIDFNNAYRYGYTRVGCWCCPNNSKWSELLSKIYMPEKYESFRNILIDFAIGIGKPDAKEYVDSGNWKARQGGNGLSIADSTIISYKTCALEENTFNYELNRPLNDSYIELFKPFGYINKSIGNYRLGEIYILNKEGALLLRIKGEAGGRNLKITILTNKIGNIRGIKSIEEKLRCQIGKYQMCIGCQACNSICRQDAIDVIEDGKGEIKYMISDEKCIRCHECISHFQAGCYMRRVLSIKR